ncbi:MAG TPA: hypothetical protein VF659_02275 [Pyrinomonadaceae bacterium]|jgi:hypothetical protein
MADERDDDDDQLIGHDSTTAPGGNKERPTGDPGRTPGKAEGDEDDVDEKLGE